MDYLKKKDNVEESQATKIEASEAMRRGSFEKFPISEASTRNLIKKGISYLFPIQYETFEYIYQGKDLIGRDRTGSGKTLAFALPILERFRKSDTFLVNKRGQRPLLICLVPTRELAIQVTREFERFKNTDNEYRVLSIYGGTDIGAQIDALRNGVEIVIGTPGRVIDLLDRNVLITSDLKHMILDETDQMLNIGFQEDIERILRKVKEEFEHNSRSIEQIQFLLFSATIPSWIKKMSSSFMKRDHVFVDMIKHSENKTSKTVEHLSIFIPTKEHKIPTIGDIVLVYGGAHSRTIIFTDKKEEANEVMLNGHIKIESQVLHGDIPQKQREVTFQSFRNGSLKCLIATNVAARGLDIPEVDLIIQLSPPNDVETYIHRSGRTGRAGKSGTCVTFYTKRQQEFMDKIEVQARMKFRKIGAPQPSDIMRATARDVAFSLDNVSDDVLYHFNENAKEILERYTPEEAISRAIAIISGYTQSVKQRSLLCSVEGLITYLMEIDYEVRSTAFFWNVLKKNFAPNVVDSIKGMKFLSNHRGVVFDLKEDYRQMFEEIAELLKKQNILISQAKELPEFEDRGDYGNPGFYNSNTYNNNFQSSGFQRNDNANSGYGNSNNFHNSHSTGNGFGNGQSYSNNGSNFQNKTVVGFTNTGNFHNSNHGGSSNGLYLRNGLDGSSNKDETKLFISNMSYDMNEQGLKELIESKGYQPLDIYIVKNIDKTSKGFGYVRFADDKQAKVAMMDLSKTRIQGRQLRVDFADKKN